MSSITTTALLKEHVYRIQTPETQSSSLIPVQTKPRLRDEASLTPWPADYVITKGMVSKLFINDKRRLLGGGGIRFPHRDLGMDTGEISNRLGRVLPLITGLVLVLFVWPEGKCSCLAGCVVPGVNDEF